MGLNYNYPLYFKREHLWDALKGLVNICDPYDALRLIAGRGTRETSRVMMAGFLLPNMK
jgi:hypothetical protein